jgi:hypothetical protein
MMDDIEVELDLAGDEVSSLAIAEFYRLLERKPLQVSLCGIQAINFKLLISVSLLDRTNLRFKILISMKFKQVLAAVVSYEVILIQI